MMRLYFPSAPLHVLLAEGIVKAVVSACVVGMMHLFPAGTGPETAAEGSYYVYTEAGLLRPIPANDPAVF